MQFAIDLIQNSRRRATLGGASGDRGGLFFLPDIVKKLSRGQMEKETLERITRFLQVKKLLLEA